MTVGKQVVPIGLGCVIHLIVEELQAGHSMFGLAVSGMAFDMDCGAGDRGGLHEVVDAADQVKTFLGWLRQERGVKDAQGADVVASHLQAAGGYMVGFANQVD